MPAVAYFLTFSTYGHWLHGHGTGSVDRQHNVYGTPLLPHDFEREQACRERMREEPYCLDEDRRETVLHTLEEVASHRGWQLWAVHVRPTHVHIVVTAHAKAEKVMSDFKAWCSRRLKERHGEVADRTRWTQHGSTRHLMTAEAVYAAVRYAVLDQGTQMSVMCDASLADIIA
jgi:REP element-mobilizing transposase RayT